MSRYKADEVQVLRGAVDHLCHMMAEVAIERSSFNPSYPVGDLAGLIHDLCDMIEHRELERGSDQPDSPRPAA